jgi:hypothetical protein
MFVRSQQHRYAVRAEVAEQVADSLEARGSSPEVGSSNSKALCLLAMAMAMAHFLRMPLE